MRVQATLSVLLLTLPAFAQESVRDLDRPGEHTKHLTIDTVDRWLFEGQADEVLRIDVRSGEFDPVLQLVRLDESGRVTEVLAGPVDDDGQQSHLLKRLPAGGQLAILVHGPGERGGGNYRLYVERLTSVPLPEGAEFLTGNLDEEGNAHVRVQAAEGDVLVPRGRGVWEVLDPKGRALPGWEGCHEVELTGEHYLRVQGQPHAPFRVGLAPVRKRALPGPELTETITGAGLDEWTLETRPGTFLVFELEHDGLELRVVRDGPELQRGLDGGPTHRWLPSHSKGGVRRMILVTPVALKRKVMVRSLGERAQPYTLRVRDVSRPLAAGAAAAGALVVGGSDYWTFPVEPGQVLRLTATSEAFDPMLRMYDAGGAQLGTYDDEAGGLAAAHTWLARQRGLVRVEVFSYGHGGGGAYALRLEQQAVPTMRIGETRPAQELTGGIDYVHLQGEAGRDVLLFTASDDLDTGLTLYDPDGVVLQSSWKSGLGRGGLLSLRLPRDGRYTLAVSGRGGTGAYTLHALAP